MSLDDVVLDFRLVTHLDVPPGVATEAVRRIERS